MFAKLSRDKSQILTEETCKRVTNIIHTYPMTIHTIPLDDA